MVRCFGNEDPKYRAIFGVIQGFIEFVKSRLEMSAPIHSTTGLTPSWRPQLLSISPTPSVSAPPYGCGTSTQDYNHMSQSGPAPGYGRTQDHKHQVGFALVRRGTLMENGSYVHTIALQDGSGFPETLPEGLPSPDELPPAQVGVLVGANLVVMDLMRWLRGLVRQVSGNFRHLRKWLGETNASCSLTMRFGEPSTCGSAKFMIEKGVIGDD
jgi:hypothetical protein